MQRLRRNQVEAAAPSAIALREATTSDGQFHAANVTVLGDYLNRHGSECGETSLAPPGKEDGDVLAIGHDLRRLSLVPRQNLLLAALDADTYADLLPHLELVPLPQDWVICEAGCDTEYAYFPTSGIVSLLYELENGASVEVALTGNDGLVGVHVFMGGGAATSRTVVRNTGHGYRLPADVLKAKFESLPLLRRPLLRYAQALIAQMTQTAVCHCHHRLEQQFNRLLLLTLDRMSSDELPLTQDALANLLGVRRESITATAGKLQAAGLIRYHRGRITVTNRARLEARACECYAVVKAELERLLPQRSSGAPPAVAVAHGYPETATMFATVPFERGLRNVNPDRSACLV